jgi:hypothetical protein
VLTEYILILLLIHDGIATIMNGVFVISVLLLRENVLLERIYTLGAACEGPPLSTLESITI